MASKKNKAQSVEERRRARRLMEQMRKEKEEDLDELQDEIEVEFSDSETAETLKKQLEAIEKDGYEEDAMPMNMGGPTSFEELDAAEAEREKAEQVRETSWKVQSLVYNILNHPMLDAPKRAAAIQKVGSDFGKRVADIISSEPEEIEKDLDLLSVQSLLAHDKRQTNLIEQLIDKAVLTTSARKKLESSDFALPEKEKYPIHDKAHVRNALARAAQEMKAGGESAADAKAAMPKIRAAAKKFGIEMTMKKDKNAIVIEKDSKGDWRWVGWVTNNFEDTDGEILCKESHEEYMRFLDANPQMVPAFITWHTPETMRKELPDFWTYENGFLIMSGKLTEKEAGSLLLAQSITDLGMSHGTLVLERDQKNPRIITKYRMYEVSDLPLENAANPFTALETLSKEADMDKKEYLAQFVGKERAERLIAQTATAQKELTEAGVVSKEAAAQPEVVTPVPPAPEIVVKEIIEQIKTELDIPGLNEFVTKAQEAMEKVPLLESALKELTANEDDRLADKIAPANGFAWSVKSRASVSTETVVADEDPLKKQAPDPGENWLSEATRTKPIAV